MPEVIEIATISLLALILKIDHTFLGWIIATQVAGFLPGLFVKNPLRTPGWGKAIMAADRVEEEKKRNQKK